LEQAHKNIVQASNTLDNEYDVAMMNENKKHEMPTPSKRARVTCEADSEDISNIYTTPKKTFKPSSSRK